jgi:hypothetical protein
MIAFAIWGLAVSDHTREAFDLSSGWVEFLLAAGAFLIPGLDTLLSKLRPPSRPATG